MFNQITSQTEYRAALDFIASRGQGFTHEEEQVLWAWSERSASKANIVSRPHTLKTSIISVYDPGTGRWTEIGEYTDEQAYKILEDVGPGVFY
jgi:hypothetical protein